MFHNIIDEEIKEEDKSFDTDNKNKRIINLKDLFSIYNFVLYAISFMVSMVSFGGEFAPFGLAMFAAVCSNKIAAGIVYISTCLGTLIRFGGSGLLSYLLTTLLFIVLTLIFRPKYQEDRNEKQKFGLHIFASTFIVQARKNVLYNIFSLRLISKFCICNTYIYIL